MWIDWAITVISVTMMWLMGNKNKWGPALGLAGQALWLYYVLTTKHWGFLPMVIIYTIIHARNTRKWFKEY